MIQLIKLPAVDAVLDEQPRAKENFVLCDLPGFADFADQVPRTHCSGSGGFLVV